MFLFVLGELGSRHFTGTFGDYLQQLLLGLLGGILADNAEAFYTQDRRHFLIAFAIGAMTSSTGFFEQGFTTAHLRNPDRRRGNFNFREPFLVAQYFSCAALAEPSFLVGRRWRLRFSCRDHLPANVAQRFPLRAVASRRFGDSHRRGYRELHTDRIAQVQEIENLIEAR